MVAHFESTLSDKGAWMYPRLFWETGVLGQVLYLEAHAIGISATGIGCFFDDPGTSPHLHLYFDLVFQINSNYIWYPSFLMKFYIKDDRSHISSKL